MRDVRIGLAAAVFAGFTLASCSGAVVTPSASPSLTATVRCDETTIRDAGERFFAHFNQRKLDELMTLFLSDARTYYVRRGDPVTAGFKESGTAEVRQMLSERMASGETIQAGPIATVSSGGSTVATGTFPDGTTRRLDVKYGYDCRRPGISQLLVTPIG